MKEKEVEIFLTRKVVLPHQDGEGDITILPGKISIEIEDGMAYIENAAPVSLEELVSFNSPFC